MKKNKKSLSETYARLSCLFVGYLGQDYYEDFHNYEEAVNAYINAANPNTVLGVIAEIESILKDKSIKDLDYSVVAYLCCAYDYEQQGLTVEQFLLKLKEDLQRGFLKKYKLIPRKRTQRLKKRKMNASKSL